MTLHDQASQELLQQVDFERKTEKIKDSFDRKFLGKTSNPMILYDQAAQELLQQVDFEKKD